MHSNRSCFSVFGALCARAVLCGLSFWTLAAGAHLVSRPLGLATFGRAASEVRGGLPPPVPHDGVRVLQPLDPAELAKCPAGGSAKGVSDAKVSSLEAPRKAQQTFLKSAGKVAAAAKQARRYRQAFACAAGCSAEEPQLEASLAPWADFKKNASGLEMIDAMEGFCKSQRASKDPFIMTVLWKGDVYLKACQAPNLEAVNLYLIGPEDLSLALIFLFGVQRVAHLPAGPISFGMYLSDYTSLLDRHLVGPGLPIFSYLGRDTSWLIPWPSSFTLISTQDVEQWEAHGGVKGTGRDAQKPWEARESKAFWIGAVTGPWEFALDDGLMAVPRLKLLKMAKEHPQQLQADWSSTAGYGISWIKDEKNVSGFLAKRSRSIEEMTGVAKSGYKTVDDWSNFKYYVNLDGVVLGGRINKLLALGGVVLQHQAGYIEHTGELMKPYEHYVPIEYDLSDLVEKVRWLQDNEAEAKRIAANGKALANKRMRFEDHVCYTWRALEALGTVTASAPVKDEEVAQAFETYKYTRATALDAGMRPTMEKFWGKQFEDIATGDRRMTDRGTELLDWAWKRMEGLYMNVEAQL